MSPPSPADNPISEVDQQRLRNLVPLHTLPDRVFLGLLDEVVLDRLGPGTLLFKQGDADHVSYYLLDGKVELLSGSEVVDSMNGGSEQARFPIANLLPRQHSARTVDPSVIARLDSRKVSEALNRSHKIDYQVDDLDDADEGDWMSQMLRSPALKQVPAANIQRVMMSVEQLEVTRGQEVIRQGEPGDFYYMLIRGHAQVKRDLHDGNEPVELARIGPGDGFGEEALLSDQARNSTVTMLDTGMVLRLAKSEFIDLIQKPLSSVVNLPEAQKQIEEGSIWLDLRAQTEFDQDHLEGAINLPLDSLRYQVESLARDRQYVIYSDTSGHATVGAFLLTERGFDVSVLRGGFARLTKLNTASQSPGPDGVQTEAAAVAPVEGESGGLQQRLAESEQRARDLEQRLAKAHSDAEGVERERQAQMDSAQLAVDQANRKILEGQQERQVAREQVTGEMEQLTSSIQTLEAERAEMADRMSEIEGQDRKLQQRLQKAERELIGERERAESADNMLEDLTRRMDELLADRAQERDQLARERGELKEEITELQMELELANADLEELRNTSQQAPAGDSQPDSEFQRQVTDLQGQRARLLEQNSGLEQQVRQLQEQLQQLQQENSELKQEQAGLQHERDGLQQEYSGVKQQLADTQAELDKLKQGLAALQSVMPGQD